MVCSEISIVGFAYWAGEVIALDWHGNGYLRHVEKSGNAATAGICFGDKLVIMLI